MAESRISYLDRTFEDYKNDIIDISQKYYPDIFNNYNDASIGNWLIDVQADIADNLSYNIDRTYQETNIDSANTKDAILNIARTNGLKISGPKCAIVEIELSCKIPMNTSSAGNSGNNLAKADENYCPYVKRGTLFSDGLNTFELAEDVDFKSQYDSNGLSNRVWYPNRDGNGNIISYTYKKRTIARAGQTRIYRKVITNNDLEPFMSITLNDSNICNVESIILKEGTNWSNDPSFAEFYVDEESYLDKQGLPVQRYFEVDNLIDQYRFGYVIDENSDGYYDPVWEVVDEFDLVDEDGSAVVDDNNNPVKETVRMAMKGEWKRLKNKFITEFTDSNKLKITFGPGIRNSYGTIPDDASDFTRYMMSRMEANDYMGVLPESGTTMYVLYRVGGGEISNVGANTIKTITSLNMSVDGNCDDPNDAKKKISVKNTMEVTNPTPSYGGKDAPTKEEIRYLVKYNSASQNRCVTLKDYYARISQIHPKYGCPFRHSVVEENNKVVIYTLGLDYQGKLMSELSETVAGNIKEYLKEYKMVNDFVEIRSGKIINLAFDCYIYVDKTYDSSEVINRVIDLIQDYMDIRRHIMGEDIYLGDLEKEISKLDGVLNLIALRCYNKVGKDNGYSDDEINQTIVNYELCSNENRYAPLGGEQEANEIDLNESDKVLYSAIDTMFEIKYPTDVRVRIKIR
jgi:hypothetical protein